MPDLGAPEAGLRRERRPWPVRGEVDGLALAPSAGDGWWWGKVMLTAGAAACSLARGGVGACIRRAWPQPQPALRAGAHRAMLPQTGRRAV